jgi:hypothetical protein
VTVGRVPPTGRVISDAVTAAVAATAARDSAALHGACAQLRTCEEQQVRDVLHVLTLGLIEQAFPDGVDADGVRALLAQVMRSAAAWLPDLDSDAIVLVLAGALSVHEPDAPTVDADALAIACALGVTHLLRQLQIPLGPELTRTFDDLRTAQTMELP